MSSKKTMMVNTTHGDEVEAVVEFDFEPPTRGYRDKYGQWEPDDEGGIDICSVISNGVDICKQISLEELDRIESKIYAAENDRASEGPEPPDRD